MADFPVYLSFPKNEGVADLRGCLMASSEGARHRTLLCTLPSTVTSTMKARLKAL